MTDTSITFNPASSKSCSTQYLNVSSDDSSS
uniref:Uncharacterized protein n=1 Tax=Siphoviridae sp. ctP0x5 TaxID=2827863 RepID=A0A8S5TG66_9CAUD|nr:MAG TPA: hypothetical protein [Siphoviridae sp. ctP0x5]